MSTISVIMSVRNAERSVAQSVAGVLDQSFSDLECIVINDGSMDGTGAILDDLSDQYKRLTVIHQENHGLTRSLNTAAKLANGKYIARQDADDFSLPSRLEKQIAALEQHDSAVLSTCWVEDVTPEGVVCGRHENLSHSVKLASGEDHPMMGIPAHGSVLMRRTAFEQAGGYRECFYYAQDSDLWLRLSELGSFVVVPEVLYRRTLSADCISSRYRDAQRRFCELAQSSFRAMKQGMSDQQYVTEAESLAEECRRRKDNATSRYDQATSMMLLGAVLADKNPELANKYFKQAVGTDWLHWRAWKGLLLHNWKQFCARGS